LYKRLVQSIITGAELSFHKVCVILRYKWYVL